MTKIEFINIITVMHRKMTEIKEDYIRYFAFLFESMNEVKFMAQNYGCSKSKYVKE